MAKRTFVQRLRTESEVSLALHVHFATHALSALTRARFSSSAKAADLRDNARFNAGQARKAWQMYLELSAVKA